MKLLHTSDWHLGKIIYGKSLLPDQEDMINRQFLPLVDRVQPDLVIIAGDIFDRQIAAAEAITLFDRLIDRLCRERGVPCAVVTGNHDSAPRISVGLSLLGKQGLFIKNSLDAFDQPAVLHTQGGTLHVYLIPYFEPAEVRLLSGDPNIRTANEAYAYLIGRIQPQLDARAANVLVTHCFAHGGVTCESESLLSVGGGGEVDCRLFACFDYTALGHLHGPQRAGQAVYYSGSPLKYSFDEQHHHKQVLEVTLNAGQQPQKLQQVQPHDINPMRDMRVITGTRDFLLEQAKLDLHPEDYIYAELTDEQPVWDAMRSLREYYPNILGLSNDWQTEGDQSERGRLQKLIHTRQATDLELFQSFYQAVSAQAPEPEQLSLFKQYFYPDERE